MNFKDILETLPSIEHLTGLDVLNGETVIHHIPAAPGKLGSLRLYNALAEKFNGKLDRTSAQQGIEWFGRGCSLFTCAIKLIWKTFSD